MATHCQKETFTKKAYSKLNLAPVFTWVVEKLQTSKQQQFVEGLKNQPTLPVATNLSVCICLFFL